MPGRWVELDRPPLSEPALRAALVRPGSFVTDLRVVAETGSTNDDVAALARAGAPEGTVLVAEAQTSGRGRLGRSWTSPPRAGLLFSVLLRPSVPMARRTWIPLLTGLAVQRAVARLGAVETRLKWPNDLLLGDDLAKAGGILAQAEGAAVVVGIGLNVGTRRAELPAGGTSLAVEAAECTDRDPILRAVLRTLGDLYRDWQHDGRPVRQALRAGVRHRGPRGRRAAARRGDTHRHRERAGRFRPSGRTDRQRRHTGVRRGRHPRTACHQRLSGHTGSGERRDAGHRVRHALPVAYPDSLLADDERVVKHLHPHWITLLIPTVLLVVVVGLASFLAAIVPGGGAQGSLRIVIGALAVIAVVVAALVPYLRWRTTHYVLTTHRLMTRIGILNHTGRDVPLNRINNALYEQSFWERIINSGTLVVESAGEDGQQVFKNIPDADQTQQLINRLVEGDHERRTRNAARYEAQYENGYQDPDPADPSHGTPVTAVSRGHG